MTKSNILHPTVGRLLPAVAVLLTLASSCRTDGDSVFEDDPPMIVSAHVAEAALTRAVEYKDHGEVTSGTFYLSYPQNNSGVNMAEVVFYETGYGKATVMPERGPLTWKQIGNGTSDRSLGLTNVSPSKHNEYDKDNPYKNPIIFRDDETQFLAGRYIPYGDEEHTNDILLASKSPYKSETETTQDHTSNYVHFELHHCMARVRVIVETRSSDASFDPLEGLLEKARVDIGNVVCKPYSFTPYIGSSTSFADAVAICPAGSTMEGCTFESINLLNTLDEGADNEWAEKGDALDADGQVIGQAFTTYDILLPPQQLRTDENRPRLRITVKDNEKGTKVYSGVLPHIMFNEKNNPLQFEFLAEHLLTIRTVISNDPPELIFMPVKVVDWVDKDRFGLEAKQAGIYDEEDFLNMIECYAKDDKTKLRRYGVFINGQWTFDIFRNLSLSRNAIEGKMKVEEGKTDYSFNFNTWFTVKVDGKEYTEKELKTLLSDKTQSL